MLYRAVFFSIALLVCHSGYSRARHLKLYTYDLAEVGTGVATYTFDYVSGPKDGTGEGNPTLHEVELEYALSKHWMQSFYVDYDYRSAGAGRSAINEVSSLKTEFNFAFFGKGEKFVDFRFNVELAKAMNNRINAYGNTDAADTAEFRFIFEKNFEKFSIVLGPMLVKDIAGPGELGGWTYGHASAIQMDISDRIGFGLEFYGSLGEGEDLAYAERQSHTVVPNLDIALTKNTTFSMGVGLPLTNGADDFTLRSAIAYNWNKFW